MDNAKVKYVCSKGNGKDLSSNSFDLDKIDFNTMDAVDATIALAKIKAKKAYLELKKQEGLYVETVLVEKVFSQIAQTIKKSFLALPNRLNSKLENVSFKARHRILIDEFNNCLQSLTVDIKMSINDAAFDAQNERQNILKREVRRKRERGIV